MTKQDKKGKRGPHHKDRKNEGKPKQTNAAPDSSEASNDHEPDQESHETCEPSTPAP